MKGMTRRIDELGRVVLPKEICRNLRLETGDQIEIEVVPAGILLSPVKSSCGICGSTENLLVLDGAAICESCARRLADIMKGEKA